MSKLDNLKTAKISIAAEDMASDGYQDKHVRKAKKKERQKGKSIIRKELKDFKKE